MKKHDNTLYITSQGAYLAKDGTNVTVRVDKAIKLRMPVHTLGGIVCFGNISCSPFLMGLCGREGVVVSFLSEQGRFMARVEGSQSGNVLLRRAQHQVSASPEGASKVARFMVIGKVANSRSVLCRYLRDHGTDTVSTELDLSIERLTQLLAELRRPLTLEQIRGVEGEAARYYFASFNTLIRSQKESFFFKQRSRRPPLDNMNALLSFVYSLLTNDAVSACESVGLDPQMGFLHADRPGRPSLALDLMEEFRPIIADRLVLSLVNRCQVQSKGFRSLENGAVEMDEKTRKTVLVAYQKRKSDELIHPFLKEKVTVGLILHIQARLLARYLRGDLDAYPSYLQK